MLGLEHDTDPFGCSCAALAALQVPIYLTIHGRGVGEPGAGRWLDSKTFVFNESVVATRSRGGEAGGDPGLEGFGEGWCADGFGDVVVHAGFEAAFAVAGHGVGGHRDDGGVVRCRVLGGVARGWLGSRRGRAFGSP